MYKPCILIPVYNHASTLEGIIQGIKQYDLSIILINDGSDDACHREMDRLAHHYRQVTVIHHHHNDGKGATIKTGLLSAAQLGFTHALQIDADGQHNIQDIPTFLNSAKRRPKALISGKPLYDKSVSKVRLYSRYLTHIWVWINTLSFNIKDSMCGFRVYPVTASAALIKSEPMGDRMDFDTEFIVRWYWRDQPIQQISTKVIYPEGGTSHFLAWRDNKFIAWMHTRLFFGMLLRSPRLLHNNIRNMLKHEVDPKASDGKQD